MSSIEEEIKVRVIARCWKDPAFKASFKKDPINVLQKEFDYKIHPDIKIKVVETKPKEIMFVIPSSPINSGSVGEKELSRMVADEKSWWPCGG